jgi:hypothetical protein
MNNRNESYINLYYHEKGDKKNIPEPKIIILKLFNKSILLGIFVEKNFKVLTLQFLKIKILILTRINISPLYALGQTVSVKINEEHNEQGVASIVQIRGYKTNMEENLIFIMMELL